MPAGLQLHKPPETPDTHPLRIAVITFSYAPAMTGIATGLHGRVRALLKRGHHVFLIRPAIDGQYADAVRFRRMPGVEEFRDCRHFSTATYPTRPHPLQASHPEPRGWRHWSDTALLTPFRPDVVVIEDAAGLAGFSSLNWGGYGKPVGAEYAAAAGVPAVALFETDYWRYGERYLGRLALRVALRALRGPYLRHCRAYATTFFPSRALLERYRTIGCWPSDFLAFHGVDCEEFRPENMRFDPISADRRPLLLFVGRIVREKSLSVLSRAFGVVLREVPDAHLAVVGTGPALPSLRCELARYGRSVTVWGESFGDPLKGLYARADAFVNPSASENFCTTNLEALASGTPVIAADAGGNGEQVAHGVNGFLAPTDDPVGVATAAVRVLRSAALRAKLSAAARQSALAYDTDACAARLEAALRQVIAVAAQRAAAAG